MSDEYSQAGKRREGTFSPRTFFENLAKSLGLTVVAGGVLLLAFALGIDLLSDPLSFVAPAGSVLGGLISLFCGFVFAKMQRGNPILCGLAAEAALSLLFCAVNPMLGLSNGGNWLLRAVCLLLSVLGALLQKKTVRPRHRRRRKS